MELFISNIVIVIFSLVFTKSIRNYGINYYLGALLIGLIIMVSPRLVHITLINQRYIGLSMIVIVMYTGILNPKRIYAKKLRSIRPQLAVMGFIFISFHAFKHLLTEYRLLWLFGLLTYIVLIPLFLTSFRLIKNNLDHHKWSTLHKFSYLAYGLLYVHLYIATMKEFYEQVIYTVIFITYFLIRIFLYVRNKIRKDKINT